MADRARLQRGICLFQLARYADARTEFRQLDARQPSLNAEESELFYAYRGLAEYNLSHAAQGAERLRSLDAAIASLDEQLEKFPNGPLAPQAAFYRAEALYARGRLDAAVVAYRALLTQYPKHPRRADALYALGVAEEEHSQFDEAANTFEQFCTEFPQHPSAADALDCACGIEARPRTVGGGSAND